MAPKEAAFSCPAKSGVPDKKVALYIHITKKVNQKNIGLILSVFKMRIT